MFFFVVSSKIYGGSPKVFGKELFTVLSGSMEPTILTGSIIAVTPNADEDVYKKGDIITFKAADNPNVLITHRIKDIQRVGNTVQYITKGDNNEVNDASPVPAKNVIGQYTGFTIQYAGFILNFVKSAAGIILCIILPGILLVVWSLKNFFQAIIKGGIMNES